MVRILPCVQGSLHHRLPRGARQTIWSKHELIEGLIHLAAFVVCCVRRMGMGVLHLYKPRQMAPDAKNCMASGVNEVVEALIKMRSKPIADIHDSAVFLARSPNRPRAVENPFQVFKTVLQTVRTSFLELQKHAARHRQPLPNAFTALGFE